MIPPNMPFAQAIKIGYVKPLRNATYLRWVKTLPCCACGAPADDPHHITRVGYGGKGTKVSDYWTIPLCRICHDELHRSVDAWEFAHGTQWEHVALTLLRAIHDGVIR